MTSLSLWWTLSVQWWIQFVHSVVAITRGQSTLQILSDVSQSCCNYQSSLCICFISSGLGSSWFAKDEILESTQKSLLVVWMWTIPSNLKPKAKEKKKLSLRGKVNGTNNLIVNYHVFFFIWFISILQGYINSNITQLRHVSRTR